mmetsp:Transcript_110169/g.310676  ORF Transcript_110169/g.310676 Transcript_110169/m.310676 type:complete len:202 (+) Transcript_110169:953-1558(+)
MLRQARLQVGGTRCGRRTFGAIHPCGLALRFHRCQRRRPRLLDEAARRPHHHCGRARRGLEERPGGGAPADCDEVAAIQAWHRERGALGGKGATQIRLQRRDQESRRGGSECAATARDVRIPPRVCEARVGRLFRLACWRAQTLLDHFRVLAQGWRAQRRGLAVGHDPIAWAARGPRLGLSSHRDPRIGAPPRACQHAAVD